MKEKIINFLESKGFNVRDLILVDGGCVVQILVKTIDMEEREEIEEQVTTQLMNFNLTLPEDQESFPCQVRSFVESENEFNIEGWLKTKYYHPIYESYINSNDTSILLREIDVDVLMWHFKAPFTFKVITNNKNMPVNDISHYYKELKVVGQYFDLECSEIKKIDDQTWEITIYR